ncbi:cation:proton antiporter domain-containing protein [Ruegeria arenilitoris]|uniref:cation:proton antiporter domain-containing protein n=1 Tax=Ruegeria arenilitoris TaxID=1173585 RepID=UPI003464E1B1
MSADFMLITFSLFFAGAIAVPLATRFGLGSVLGYLIAGIALSPILGAIGADLIALQHFAEFGVVMMLFLIGLEMNPRELWALRNRIFVLGGLQIGLTTMAFALIALVLGQPWTVSLAIGLVLALSSTAIVNQTLKEKGLSRSDGGQSSFSVLLAQDIAVIPMLALVPLLALPELTEALSHGSGHADDHGGSGFNISLVEHLSGWQTAIVTVMAIGGVIVIGQYLVTPLFRFVARARLRELFVSTALMVVLGIALLMTMVGLSPALGTFLAGVVLASSEYRHEIESDIDPFRGLFLGVFFMTVGAGMDFDLLFGSFGSIMGMTFGLIAVKAIILLVLAQVFKIKGSDQWLFGLGLAQAGEFGFVLLSFTVANAVIPAGVADTLLLVIALSMLTTPLMFIVHERLIVPRYISGEDTASDEIEDHSGIIIAGHGRVGGIVNTALRASGYETTVVDYSSQQLEMLRLIDLKVYYGDATRHDLLKAAGIDEAKLLIVAIDGKDQTTELVRYVCETHPNVHVIARAYDRIHVFDLWDAGCRDIIRETYDGSIRTARSALEALGHTKEAAERMMAEYDAFERTRMLETAELHKPGVAIHENEEMVAKYQETQSEWEAELRDRVHKAKTNQAE